jgi:hypothetical protein
MCATQSLERARSAFSWIRVLGCGVAFLCVAWSIPCLGPATEAAGWRNEMVAYGEGSFNIAPHRSRIAIGPDGSVHIVAAPTMGLDTPLMYAHKNAGTWATEPHSAGFLGGLGVDSAGNVHTAYEPNYRPQFRDGAHYAVRTGGAWHDEKIESYSALPALFVDSSDTVHVAYTAGSGFTSPDSVYRVASRQNGIWVPSDAVLFDSDGTGVARVRAMAADRNGWR